MDLLQILRKRIYEIGILLLVVLIFVTNYVPNTYLIGWDSLQTELNPKLGITRSLFSSWQEYQSFGLPAGMAHASDLVRAVLVWFATFILPTGAIRYLFHTFMLLLGGLGAFHLLSYLGFGKNRRILAFVGACFYILNLGTVQIFAVPFEPFSVLFGLLPWEILVFLRFLYSPKQDRFKNLAVLFLVNLLATPQAYIQTLFLVYIIVLFSTSVLLVLKDFTVSKVRRFLLAFGVIFVANMFWILPQIYFLATSGGVTEKSKINQLATGIVVEKNLEKGSYAFLARFEGFYYDLVDTQNEPLFSAWHAHRSSSFMTLLSYVPFIFILIGLLRGSNKYRIPFTLAYVVILVFLLGDSFPFSILNSYLKTYDPFAQVFRSSFTKFAVAYALISSYFLVSGLDVTIGSLMEGQKRRIYFRFSFILVTLIVFASSFPVFTGNFYLRQMKVDIPEDYFHVMSYFEELPENSRLALFPDYIFWGWFSHKWGYDGSGFLWYGLKQPVISRTFDVWSNNSESYFWEVKHAVESRNVKFFENILTKYNVDYALLDFTLLPVSSIEEALQYDQIDSLLAQSDRVQVVDKLFDFYIAKVSRDFFVNDFISLGSSFPNIGPRVYTTNLDTAYMLNGPYISDESVPYDYYYPFLDLHTARNNGDETMWEITETDTSFVLHAKLGKLDLDLYELDVPEDEILDAKVFDGSEIVELRSGAKVAVEDGSVVVTVKKDLVHDFDLFGTKVINCRNKLPFYEMTTVQALGIKAKSWNRGTACFGYELPFLAHWNGYIIKTTAQNHSGKPLFHYIVGNKIRRQSRLESSLADGSNYSLIPPGYFFDDGYEFSFQNISYQDMESENDLLGLEVYVFPYNYLKNIRFIKKGVDENTNIASFTDQFSSKKLNVYLYEVTGINNNETLILQQEFEPGWEAFVLDGDTGGFVRKIQAVFPFFSGKRLSNHYEVNNWANGWDVDSVGPNERVIIIFWPQWLEYTGLFALAMLGQTLALLYIRENKKRKNIDTPPL